MPFRRLQCDAGEIHGLTHSGLSLSLWGKPLLLNHSVLSSQVGGKGLSAVALHCGCQAALISGHSKDVHLFLPPLLSSTLHYSAVNYSPLFSCLILCVIKIVPAAFSSCCFFGCSTYNMVRPELSRSVQGNSFLSPPAPLHLLCLGQAACPHMQPCGDILPISCLSPDWPGLLARSPVSTVLLIRHSVTLTASSVALAIERASRWLYPSWLCQKWK